MQKDIRLTVQLDNDRLVDSIHWEATDKPADASPQIKCFSLAIWDQEQRGTLRLDMWDKNMTMDEMNQFVVQAIGGLSELLANATGNEETGRKIAQFAHELGMDLQKQGA